MTGDQGSWRDTLPCLVLVKRRVFYRDNPGQAHGGKVVELSKRRIDQGIASPSAGIEAAALIGNARVCVQGEWISYCIGDVLKIASSIVVHQSQVRAELQCMFALRPGHVIHKIMYWQVEIFRVRGQRGRVAERAKNNVWTRVYSGIAHTFAN